MKSTLRLGIDKDFAKVYGLIISGALSIAIRDSLMIPMFSDMLLDRDPNE
jgi:hypothetical protein